MDDAIYQTQRLIVRDWRESDRPTFAAMNADPDVMRHFAKALTRTESDVFFDRIAVRRSADGFAFPAVELKSSGEMIGMVGLQRVTFEAAFTPAVEIGWRIRKDFWRQGYASEAAAAALRYGFEALGLEEIVSFTIPVNAPSRAVMASIGMTRDALDDFRHPSLPEDWPLSRHVLYRINRRRWAAARA